MYVYYKLKGKVSYLRFGVFLLINYCSLYKYQGNTQKHRAFSKYKYIYHCAKQDDGSLLRGLVGSISVSM